MLKNCVLGSNNFNHKPYKVDGYEIWCERFLQELHLPSHYTLNGPLRTFATRGGREGGKIIVQNKKKLIETF